MLYYIAKILINIFYRVYYRIGFKGLKKIPHNKSVILAPNHTNAFIDPGVIAMGLPQKIRFFARGDVFKGRLAKWALNDLNISPMYRIQEGYSELKKNDKIFEECRNLLSNNKTLLLFPEAICIQEQRLQPLKKGLARIIFQTEELFDFKKNVWIVPVGLNYSNAKKFGSRLFINIGEPISILKYEEQYKQDKAKTINEFTKLLEQEMAKLIIVISNKENDKLVEELTEIYLYHWMKSENYDPNDIEKQYYASKEIADMINYHDKENPALVENLRKEVTSYCRQLQKLGLCDYLLRPEVIHKMNLWKFFLDAFILFFGMPLYILGLVTNYPPYYISRNFADREIKKVEFYASIYANMSMLLWVIFYAIQLLVAGFVFRNLVFLGLYALLVPGIGFYTLRFYPVIKKILGRLNLLRLVRKERKTIEHLMMKRSQIMTDVEFAKKEQTPL